MAYDIKSAMFAIRVDGQPVRRDTLLDWGPRDRLGIVVDRPFGALDAALMIMLSATAFYDAGAMRRKRPLYPDMYLFHSGGPWGAHSALDFAPDHKEIMVAPDPREMLRAVNHVGITHLLLPDSPPRPVQHRFKEPEAALDRMKQVFVYGPGLTGTDGPVEIEGSPFAALEGTFRSTIDPEPYLDMLETMGSAPQTRVTDRDELTILIPLMRSRLGEVRADDADRLRQIARVRAAAATGAIRERYRPVDVQTALQMLSPNAA